MGEYRYIKAAICRCCAAKCPPAYFTDKGITILQQVVKAKLGKRLVGKTGMFGHRPIGYPFYFFFVADIAIGHDQEQVVITDGHIVLGSQPAIEKTPFGFFVAAMPKAIDIDGAGFGGYFLYRLGEFFLPGIAQVFECV